MAWSKVKKPKEKPMRWWWHKVWCEIGYLAGGSTNEMYRHHLKIMCVMGWNLYGEKW